MSRKLLINIHLYLAAFLSPIVLVTALSGGLYLLGIKGAVEKEVISSGDSLSVNFNAEDKKLEIQQFINTLNIQHEFEYAVGGDSYLMTRPTSKLHYSFELVEDKLVVTKRTPDLIASIVELHKGHGPSLYKKYQTGMSLGLMLILLSGFYLGVSAPGLRKKTLTLSALGSALFLLLALV